MADAQYTIDTSDLARTQNELKQWAATNRKAVSSVKSDMVSVGRVQDMWAKDQKRRMALINNSRKLEERAAKAQAAETQKLQREYDKYRASIDDVFAAQQKYNSLVLTITQRNKSLGVSTEKTTKELEELKQKFQEIGVVINRNGKVLSAQNRNFSQFGTVTAKGGKSMSRFNMIMQQGGFQLQDFIVQLQGGTSIFTAFSQQGSQFAGIFGPTGAIVGAVIALGSAIGGLTFGLSSASGGAKGLKTDIEGLQEAVESYKSSVESASASTKDIAEKYGVASKELRLVLKDFAAIEKLNATKALNETAEALNDLVTSVGFFDDVKTRVGQATRFLFGYYNVLKTGEVEAGQLFSQNLKILDESRDAATRLQAALNLREILLKNTGGLENMNEEQVNFLKSLGQVIQEMEILRGSTDSVSSSLGNAVNEALNLRDALAAAGRASMSRKDQIDSLSAQIAAAKSGASVAGAKAATEAVQDLRKSGATIDQIVAVSQKAREEAAQIEALQATLSKLTRPEKKTNKKGGGSVSADPLDKLLSEISRRGELLSLFGQEKALLEEIFSVEDALGKERGKYSDEFIQGLAQQRIALKQLEEEQKKALQQQQALTDSIAGSFGDAFSSVVDGTKTVEDAFRDMAKSIIKQLFEVLVVQRLVGSFNASTGQGSGLAGLIGPALGGFFADGAAFKNGSVQAFASGGVVDSPTFFGMSGGQTGLMGEAGPEAIMPLKRGPDGKLGVTTTGGQRPINITMNISTPDVKGFEKSRTQIASGLQQSLAQGGRNS